MKEVKADNRIKSIFRKRKFAAVNSEKRYISDAYAIDLFTRDVEHIGANVYSDDFFKATGEANRKSPGSTSYLQNPGISSRRSPVFDDPRLKFIEKYAGMGGIAWHHSCLQSGRTVTLVHCQ